jgi:hypothetical protein
MTLKWVRNVTRSDPCVIAHHVVFDACEKTSCRTHSDVMYDVQAMASLWLVRDDTSLRCSSKHSITASSLCDSWSLACNRADERGRDELEDRGLWFLQISFILHRMKHDTVRCAECTVLCCTYSFLLPPLFFSPIVDKQYLPRGMMTKYYKVGWFLILRVKSGMMLVLVYIEFSGWVIFPLLPLLNWALACGHQDDRVWSDEMRIPLVWSMIWILIVLLLWIILLWGYGG